MSPFLNERLFDLYGAPAAYETMDIAPGGRAGGVAQRPRRGGGYFKNTHNQAKITISYGGDANYPLT